MMLTELATPLQQRRDDGLFSRALGRAVRLDVLLPPGFDPHAATAYPVLYMQDGQDLRRLHLPATLRRGFRAGLWRPFVVVAVHAANRLEEYGVAARPDYLGRGGRAGRYTRFMLDELLPYAQARYRVSADPAQVLVAGFSLSGLLAFDLAWHHPEAFGWVGAFSGSFWWRTRALRDGYTDADRLMHQLVHARPAPPGQLYWLQTGTLDETSDRNHNGIIDAIDDTLDLLAALRQQGVPPAALRYLEVPGGHHHPRTWAAVLPDLLSWAFGAPAAGPLPDPAVAARRPALPLRQRRPGPDGLRPPRGARRRPVTFVPMPDNPALTRPAPGTYLPYYQLYIDQVPADADPLALLTQVPLDTELAPLSDSEALLRYAPGKWTPKEILLHVVDSERVFAYRALRFARGDDQPLPGFDQDLFVAQSQANARKLPELLAEYRAVRAATVALFQSLGARQLDRPGQANGGPSSPRALLYIILGHELHHLAGLRQHYWPLRTAAPQPAEPAAR